MKRERRDTSRRDVTRLRRRVSDLKTTERGIRLRLRNAEEARRLAEGIFQTVREPLLILDARLRVLAANRSFYRVFRVTPGETIDRYIYELGKGQWNIARLRLLLEKVLPFDRVFEGFDVECAFPGGGRRVMLLNARRIEESSPDRATILLAFEDVTEQRRSAEKLEAASVSDELTGLRNRRGLLAAAKELSRKSTRRRKRLVVMFLDVDNLKSTNDRFGHAKGDRLLMSVSRLVRKTFPEARVAARVGGDEFVVVFDDKGDAEALKDRLKAAVSLRNAARPGREPISISSGIARGDAAEFDDVMERADAAMYEEKLGRRRARR